jgi:hypothetical protein
MSAETPRAAASDPVGKRRPQILGLPLKFAKRLLRLGKWAIGAAGALVTILSLVFLVRPSLQPKGAPEVKGATLSKPSIDAAVTFGQYLARVKEPRAGHDARALARRGVLIQFHVEIRGDQGKSLPLRWSVLNTSTGASAFDADPVRLRAGAADDSADWPLWAPQPSRPGTYYVFIQLYDPYGRLALDHLRTPAFSVP